MEFKTLKLGMSALALLSGSLIAVSCSKESERSETKAVVIENPEGVEANFNENFYKVMLWGPEKDLHGVLAKVGVLDYRFAPEAKYVDNQKRFYISRKEMNRYPLIPVGQNNRWAHYVVPKKVVDAEMIRFDIGGIINEKVGAGYSISDFVGGKWITSKLACVLEREHALNFNAKMIGKVKLYGRSLFEVAADFVEPNNVSPPTEEITKFCESKLTPDLLNELRNTYTDGPGDNPTICEAADDACNVTIGQTLTDKGIEVNTRKIEFFDPSKIID